MNLPKQVNKATIINQLKRIESKSTNLITPSTMLTESLTGIWDLNILTEKQVLMVVNSLQRTKHKYIVTVDF
jgi:hypothetical protein